MPNKIPWWRRSTASPSPSATPSPSPSEEELGASVSPSYAASESESFSWSASASPSPSASVAPSEPPPSPYDTLDGAPPPFIFVPSDEAFLDEYGIEGAPVSLYFVGPYFKGLSEEYRKMSQTVQTAAASAAYFGKVIGDAKRQVDSDKIKEITRMLRDHVDPVVLADRIRKMFEEDKDG